MLFRHMSIEAWDISKSIDYPHVGIRSENEEHLRFLRWCKQCMHSGYLCPRVVLLCYMMIVQDLAYIGPKTLASSAIRIYTTLEQSHAT